MNDREALQALLDGKTLVHKRCNVESFIDDAGNLQGNPFTDSTSWEIKKDPPPWHERIPKAGVFCRVWGYGIEPWANIFTIIYGKEESGGKMFFVGKTTAGEVQYWSNAEPVSIDGVNFMEDFEDDA